MFPMLSHLMLSHHIVIWCVPFVAALLPLCRFRQGATAYDSKRNTPRSFPEGEKREGPGKFHLFFIRAFSRGELLHATTKIRSPFRMATELIRGPPQALA